MRNRKRVLWKNISIIKRHELKKGGWVVEVKFAVGRGISSGGQVDAVNWVVWWNFGVIELWCNSAGSIAVSFFKTLRAKSTIGNTNQVRWNKYTAKYPTQIFN